MAKGGYFLEKVRRCVRTVFFMVAMVASLLVSSLPVLVAIGDMLVPCVLISSFTCIRCYGFKEHLHRYAFKSSLTDIPLVSFIRSLIIICVYSMCDGPALSHGPYLGTVTFCSFVSILLLSIKACLFTVNSQIEAEASSSLSRQKLHLKKSWGMPVLFLSSVVFALGHTVVAYRTSCRARRKLLFHRVDPEAVLSCKNVFSGYQKVPRSPTPSGGRTPKSDSEMRRKPFSTTRDGELPVRVIADIDSLFMTCRGLSLHYKLSLPGSPPRSLSSTVFLEPSSPKMAMGRPKLDRHPLEIPALRLSNAGEEDEGSTLNFGPLNKEMEGSGQFGIVLVHGFGGGVFSWRHVMGTLSRQVGCTVAAFDRPGWGLTSRLRPEDWEDKEMPNPYKLESQVDLLLSFCSEMGFSSVVLVGHDDGGLLALMAAQKVQASVNSFNVTIKGVVLLNVSLSREVVPAFARILLRTSLGKKHLVRPLLRTEITQVVNRRAWYDASKLTTDVLSLYKAPLCLEGWDEALHEIGAEDALVSLKSSQAMASRLVNSRLVAISGCGHLPHEECPKALLAAMTPFLSRLLGKQDRQSQ
ncbi:hypothetical protein ACFX12_025144 [Malus domestica]